MLGTVGTMLEYLSYHAYIAFVVQLVVFILTDRLLPDGNLLVASG